MALERCDRHDEQQEQGDREGRIARARGEAERFTQVLAAYSQARDVPRQRLYLETMEGVLRNIDKTIVETPGVTPYLPLDRLPRGQSAPAEPTQGAGR